MLAAIPAATIGALLLVSPLAAGLRMAPLPIAYLLWLMAVTAAFGLAAHLVKRRYLPPSPALALADVSPSVEPACPDLTRANCGGAA